MNYIKSIQKYSLYLFVFSSIFIFSFAPFLALKSSLTRIFSYIFYLFVGLGFLMFTVCAIYTKKKLHKILVLFSFLTIYSVLGILKSNFSAFVSYFSNAGIPIMMVFVFYSIKYLKIKSRPVFSFFYICVLVNCLVAIFQVFTFDGDFSKLYVKDVIGEATYNYIRNGRLRAFGLLQSAVIFSNYISISLTLTLFNIKKRNFFITRIIFILIQFFCLYLTGSRTPFLAIAFVLGMFCFFNKHRKIFPLFSIFCIGFLLAFLTFTSGMDLSALGRIAQYTEASMLFLQNPFGYGIGYASYPKGVVSYDCSILTILLNFGIQGFVFMLILYGKTLKKPAKESSDFICDGLVMILFILSGFANIIHLGILSLVIIFYYLKLGEKSEKAVPNRSL